MPKKQRIKASASAGGSITPSGIVEIKYGRDQSFTITPDTGYHVDDVLVDGISVGAVTTYTFAGVVAYHAISVSFTINVYTISTTVIPAGAEEIITPYGEILVEHGADQTFLIGNLPGYFIVSLKVDGVGVAAGSYTFTEVVANHQISIDAQPIPHYIVASAGVGGSIEPYGSVEVMHRYSRTFSIIPDTGYHVDDVLVDSVSVGAVTSYTFTADTFTEIGPYHTISVSFAINVYTIKASAGVGGSITPSGAILVEHGADQIFGILPDVHLHVSDVIVDGSSVGPVSKYSFRDIITDHRIQAIFSKHERQLRQT